MKEHKVQKNFQHRVNISGCQDHDGTGEGV